MSHRHVAPAATAWFFALLLHAALAPLGAAAQGIGTPETHPQLTTSTCTVAGGCVAQRTSIVLDASFHDLRSLGGGGGVSPRVYLLEEKKAGNATTRRARGGGVVRRQEEEEVDNYKLLFLRNQEFSFDVDVSKLACGMNGALYLTEMDATGARGDLNAAGAGYGTGYCDAQCPVAPFINGVANLDAKGACCHEMDLWEANSRATTFTPHVCSNAGMHACASVEDCGSLGACDKSGCQYNNYQLGNKTFYGPGPGFTLDTTRPLTVTTQFLNDSWGGLNEIRRLYVQGGRVLANAAVNDPYWPPGDSIKMSHCQARSDFFEELGGLRQMGRALDRGMVLVFRLWSDPGQFMNWLDAGEQGPCSFTEGDPADILRDHGDTAVTFSNIRWGELESTYKNSTG